MKTRNDNKLGVSYLKDALRMQENMLAIDQANTKLLALTPEARAAAEIKDRIIRGLTDGEKLVFQASYEQVLNLIVDYFHKHKIPRCPAEVYLKSLRMLGVKPKAFFRMVALNDGAIYRWQQRTGEWLGYSRSEALRSVASLKTRIENSYTNASEEQHKYAATIFDGKVTGQ